jgi:hypothetical protein
MHLLQRKANGDSVLPAKIRPLKKTVRYESIFDYELQQFHFESGDHRNWE